MVKILCIAGAGRSGSTIVQNVLGQIDGFTAVGEIRYIWGRAALENQSCGCGARFRECPFWTSVLDDAFGGISEQRARALLELTESFRVHKLPLTWIPAARRRELQRLEDYRSTLGLLYAAVQRVSGCRVVIDSSKNPAYAYLLAHTPGLDVYYLHFVRDSPGVAHSWGKHKDFEPGVPMARKSPAASGLQWLARNAAAECFLPMGRTRRWRYEDFMAAPRDHVASIVRWLDEPNAPLLFLSQHEAELTRRSHSVFGNSIRFATGTAMLQLDQRWRGEMAAADRRMVEVITAPLRWRYGYLGPRARSGRPRRELPA
ncbi:MAG: sulfotransferase [Propionibacteriales bacterium]|jgi:hypothetical protein|nr:sulfotransferase [Propionibacteriales bacterium]